MQQEQKTKPQKWLMTMIAIVWVTGLLIAGSDNPYMPWANGFGLLLFLLASLLLSKKLGSPSGLTNGSTNSGTIHISFPKMNQTEGRTILNHATSNQRLKQRINQRMKIRYAQ